MKLILVVLSIGLCGFLATGVEGINGGSNAQLGQFKYMVGIEIVKSKHLPFTLSDHTYICGGAIIGEKYILSAAHCFTEKHTNGQAFEFRKHKVTVYANTISLKNKHLKESHVIERTAVNVYFVPKFFENGIADIAVLELNTILDVMENDLEIVNLPIPIFGTTFGYYTDVEASLIGYGKDVVTNTKNILKRMFAKDVDIEQCSVIAYGADHERFICADGIEIPLSACEGDSGSPLVHEVWNNDLQSDTGDIEVHKTVIGVMSLGGKCYKDKKFPNLFTRVSFYENFITSAMAWTENTDILLKYTYLME